MITLAKKIKEEREKKEKGNNATENPKSTRISVRDKLLTKGELPVCVRNYCTKYVSCIKLLISVPSSFSKISFNLAFGFVAVSRPPFVLFSVLEVTELEENLPGELGAKNTLS